MRWPTTEAMQAIIRGTIALLVVGAFVIAGWFELEQEYFNALNSVASGIIGYYFGEAVTKRVQDQNGIAQ